MIDKVLGLQATLVFTLIFLTVFFRPINKTNIQAPLFNDLLIESGEQYFENMKQLTFSGENAEAYFSLDGKSLIFQGHDSDSLCDQIYILDITSGQKEMVSTGDGVTTCSYFEYPQCENIIYSSTHLSNRECPEKPDYSKGYVWKLYPGYDIFKSNLDGDKIEQLTSTPNYDAEATVAFDGSKILFTSMASGDLEVWIMNTDGTDKRALTDRLGYDGGAFFNHDASKIVWRVYHPESEKEIKDYRNLLEDNSIRPMALQIWTMNSDGSNKNQVTNNNAANFGPYFFPNGEKIIFSSNLHDPSGRNFDLYSINTDGSDLERITMFKGFDGFPMFSPDGKFLVFSSNRNQEKKGDTNLFLCKWKNI